MLLVALTAMIISIANGQGHIRDFGVNPYESPKPYSFQYSAPLDGGVGQSSRSESADSSGRVQGSYTLNNDEGHYRVVEYVADENGFRANIRTNEPGTESKNPADVVIISEAGPYPYTPIIRRPVLNAGAVSPLVPIPPPEPVVVPVLPPVRRPVYRRPVLPRDYQYRPNRYQNRRY